MHSSEGKRADAVVSDELFVTPAHHHSLHAAQLASEARADSAHVAAVEPFAFTVHHSMHAAVHVREQDNPSALHAASPPLNSGHPQR
jgi:hypothetical protein